jgi:hypothetical protein
VGVFSTYFPSSYGHHYQLDPTSAVLASIGLINAVPLSDSTGMQAAMYASSALSSSADGALRNLTVTMNVENSTCFPTDGSMTFTMWHQRGGCTQNFQPTSLQVVIPFDGSQTGYCAQDTVDTEDVSLNERFIVVGIATGPCNPFVTVSTAFELVSA